RAVQSDFMTPNSELTSLGNRGRVCGAETGDLETLLRQLGDEADITGVVRGADGEEIGSRRLLGKVRRDSIRHLHIAIIEQACHELLPQHFKLGVLAVEFSGQRVQIAAKVKVYQLSRGVHFTGSGLLDAIKHRR